jgi:hypothetical protein
VSGQSAVTPPTNRRRALYFTCPPARPATHNHGHFPRSRELPEAVRFWDAGPSAGRGPDRMSARVGHPPRTGWSVTSHRLGFVPEGARRVRGAADPELDEKGEAGESRRFVDAARRSSSAANRQAEAR